jgi:hypothetical protein
LIKDPDLLVRRAAIRSVPGTGRRDLIPVLLELLEDPELCEDAENALARYGDRVVGTLGDHLADPEVPVSIKKMMPRVLSLIGSQNAVNALLRVSFDEDPAFSEQVLRALGRIRRDHQEILIPEREVTDRMHGEIERYLELLQQQDTVGKETASTSRDLLLRVLAERSTQALRRLFRVLALMYPRKETRLAYRGVVAGNARLHAQAVEYLESVLSAEHRRIVVPIVEPASRQDRMRVESQRLGKPRLTLEGILRAVAQAPDAWLNGCAFHMIGTQRLMSLQDLVSQCSASSDALVREMAQWAAGRLKSAREEE